MSIFLKSFLVGSAVVAAGACAWVCRGKSQPIDLGSQLPSLEVENHEGKTLRLSELADEEFVLVYFYPKADTPGCTAQACSLRDAFEELSENGVKVFGVSGDSVKDQASFHDKYELPFELLSDRQGQLAEAFGVPVRFTRFPARQSFLFQRGRLVWRDLSASTARQAADVLEHVKGASDAS